jgi:hypothetical protein
MDLAHAVIEAHEGDREDTASVSIGLELGRASSGSGSLAHSTVSDQKKRIPDAVITIQRPEASKRGCQVAPPATADWLRGVASGRASGNRVISDWQGGKMACGSGGCSRRGHWLRVGQRGRGRWW